MSDKYELVNAYDDIVKSQVRQFIEQEDGMCKCEKCFLDTCAIVFNRGYTNFVTTQKGQVLTQIEEAANSNHIELTVSIMDAIKMVKVSPQHNE